MVWGSEHPHAALQHITDSTKVNLWRDLLHNHLTRSPFFAKATVTPGNYLDKHETSLIQLQEIEWVMFLQKEGTPPQYSLNMHAYPNQHFPNQSTGHSGSISRPARSSDITLCDFVHRRIHKRLCLPNSCG
jgi:hypothetical protein